METHSGLNLSWKRKGPKLGKRPRPPAEGLRRATDVPSPQNALTWQTDSNLGSSRGTGRDGTDMGRRACPHFLESLMVLKPLKANSSTVVSPCRLRSLSGLTRGSEVGRLAGGEGTSAAQRGRSGSGARRGSRQVPAPCHLPRTPAHEGPWAHGSFVPEGHSRASWTWAGFALFQTCSL